MLTSSSLPVSEIAKSCGFNGASQFGRTFRNAVGSAPLQFRRRT
ncbi:MAG: helix-turn-helix transcriptional regulator [Rhizobiaceae bacterium]|nr:helix-turn-helix transcriptional regulator [Rhizobiaceae bacterium]